MGLPAAEAMQTAAAIDVADRNSRHASLTLAFAQPGDTLLYLLLPLDHAAFGVSLAEAGLLLAANRLVRIAGYGWGRPALCRTWAALGVPAGRARVAAVHDGLRHPV